MKKYFFGLTAIVLAIGFSAFTKPASKPFAVASFQLPTSFSRTVAANIETETNWDLASPNCGATAEVACKIELDSKYYHVDQSTFATIINTPAYIASGTGRDPADEVGEAALVLTAQAVNISGTNYYKVDVANSPGVVTQTLRAH